MVNPEFAKWAKGFSGCDGGNPQGKVWLCGIEYGGTLTEELPFVPMDVPDCVGEENYGRAAFLKYHYNWRAIRLLAAFAGDVPSNCETFFREQSCFDRNSNYFKLNLFPFAFKDTSHKHWPGWLAKKTGLKTKQEYLEWCVVNRFPLLKEWVSRYSPRLIICTGKSHLEHFMAAFGTRDEIIENAEAAGKQIPYFLTNTGRTLVVIVYFLGGRYGLTADKQLLTTGKKLADLERNCFGKK
jgi:hypothetical protein